MSDVNSNKAKSEAAGPTTGLNGSVAVVDPVRITERRDEASALTVVAPGGPVVVEVELTPLAVRRTLPPSSDQIESRRTQAGFWRGARLFSLTVVLPMLIGSLYLIVFAAPRFASSTSFIVRAVASSAPLQTAAAAAAAIGQQSVGAVTAPGRQPVGAVTAAGQTTVVGQQPTGAAAQETSAGQQTMASAVQQPGATGESTIAQEETYSINAYLTSRDVVDRLSKNNRLRAILSRPEGDFLFRFPNFWLPDNEEFLYQRFLWMVSARVDSYTMISTVEVNAFEPQDAQALATAMLEYAEGLVNQMNQRAYEDGIAAAERLVAEARKEFDAAEAQLKAYRNATGSIDPQAVGESKLKLIEALWTQLAQIQATIAQQRAITPTSPNLAPLEAQAESYREEIEKRKREIAGTSGSEVDKLATYEQLTTRASLAASALAFAVAQREQARQDAERQHFFIQVISRPNLSLDYARYPRVALDLAALLAICLATFHLLRKATET